MTDYFAALGQPRRPWLEAELLQEKFHTLSHAVHPDHVHQQDAAGRAEAGARYAELNAAYQCLRQPKSRLEHLLVLERGTKPGDLRTMPEDIVQYFGAVGAVLRKTSGLLAEKAQVTSAILKAGLIGRALPQLGEISALQTAIQARLARVTEELRMLDGEWAVALHDLERRDTALATAEKLYHLFGFLERWQQQLQERSFQLTV